MQTLYEVLKEINQTYSFFEDYTEDGLHLYDSNTVGLRFDLERKNIYAGNYCLMQGGRLMKDVISIREYQSGEQKDINIKELPYIEQDVDPYKKIEELFAEYYSSLPTVAEKQDKHYFKTKSDKEIGLAEMEKGIERSEARCALEAYVLLASVMGYLPWDNSKHFYWRSKREPELVLYKTWCNKTPRN